MQFVCLAESSLDKVVNWLPGCAALQVHGLESLIIAACVSIGLIISFDVSFKTRERAVSWDLLPAASADGLRVAPLSSNGTHRSGYGLQPRQWGEPLRKLLLCEISILHRGYLLSALILQTEIGRERKRDLDTECSRQ